MSSTSLPAFFKKESAGGICLMIAAFFAMLVANTPLSHYYDMLLQVIVEVRVADWQIEKPLLLWINDGLMAFFFLVVGLELKREFLEGELADRTKVVFPVIAAVGGMAVPALVYLLFNHSDPLAVRGWAIPAATDIAFALGVLALLGSRVPVSVKVFLTALAIFDDIGAILIIAFFYTSKISAAALWIVACCLVLLWLLNREGVMARTLYLFIGIIMWVAMLKSGVHATLTGVLLAFFIPLNNPDRPDHSPLKELESELHTLVAFFVLPVFAFANAGINVLGMTTAQFFHSIPVGIAMGLFVGKQLGIFGLCWLSVKLKLVELPEGLNWRIVYGVSALAGIGFTMSLFIGSLTFEETGVNLVFDERLGIMIGSLASGLLGYWVLDRTLPKKAAVLESKA